MKLNSSVTVKIEVEVSFGDDDVQPLIPWPEEGSSVIQLDVDLIVASYALNGTDPQAISVRGHWAIENTEGTALIYKGFEVKWLDLDAGNPPEALVPVLAEMAEKARRARKALRGGA